MDRNEEVTSVLRANTWASAPVVHVADLPEVPVPQGLKQMKVIKFRLRMK